MPNQLPDLLSPEGRVRVIQDIKSEDNLSRKRDHQRRHDVYLERQDRYILERLEDEFSVRSVNEMRKILSVNPTTRIIDEMSSVYSNPPDRSFSRLDKEISESEEAQLEELYDDSKVNQALRKANQFYNLHDQCALMVVPNLKGGLKIKAIQPVHYDVIPDPINPEEAHAYILNVWNFDLHKTAREEDVEQGNARYKSNDRINQVVADDNDRLAAEERYIVWTKDFTYTMDGHGNLITELMPNPIGMLPFVDVADDKDFQFFVRRGTSVVDFSLDVGVLLSDLSNIIRMQGYSQAVIASSKKPEDSRVGPTHLMWLKQDDNAVVQPSFQFVTPSPDIAGSLEFLETTIRLFLASRGIDPGTISGKGQAKSFSSGIERLLAMLDKFEATRADYDLFSNVEQELYKIIVAWSNVFQSVVGENGFKDSLKQGMIGEDVFMDLKFNEPMITQTKSEKEDSAIKLIDAGLMSQKEAIMDLREVSEEKADQLLKDINDMKMERMEEFAPQLMNEDGTPIDNQQDDDGSTENNQDKDQPEDQS